MNHTTDRPGWHYEEPVTGREMTYTMGYITDDLIPCMALFAGDDNAPILIPVDVLAHAVGLAAVKEHAEAAIAEGQEGRRLHPGQSHGAGGNGSGT